MDTFMPHVSILAEHIATRNEMQGGNVNIKLWGARLRITNKGPGLALNIRSTTSQPDRFEMPVRTALGPGEDQIICNASMPSDFDGFDLVLSYDDVFGRPFISSYRSFGSRIPGTTCRKIG